MTSLTQRKATVRIAFVFFVLIGFATPTYAQEFEEGQAWKYETRAYETTSTLYILKVDEHASGAKIYSLAIDGLKIEGAKLGGMIQEFLPHVPVGEESLSASVTELISTDSGHTMNEEAYEYWKSEYELGRAGWWSLPITDILSAIEVTLQ